MITCLLCEADQLTARGPANKLAWTALCVSHPNKWLVILSRHDRMPNHNEILAMEELMEDLITSLSISRNEWRKPKSIPEHFHWHQK